ncbi:uncharacterized protein LOC108903511 [Anoplophora glabripennis]|uniref:uncharacterized protein LOC108903511 n=1 Tax=Anoplophora glabripennis TaxID=217634 RepID=UPI000873C237|nr:uncharacterized protein LOC108903511 [Anoplophora glabripennis]
MRLFILFLIIDFHRLFYIILVLSLVFSELVGGIFKMVRYRNCAVVGCEDITSPRHRFPNPAKKLELFKIWTEACCRDILKTLSPDLVYRSYRICHIHFATEDISTNNFLKPDVIPKLFLPPNRRNTDMPEDTVSTSTPTQSLQSIEKPSTLSLVDELNLNPESTQILCVTPTRRQCEVTGEHVFLQTSIKKRRLNYDEPSTSAVQDYELPNVEESRCRTPRNSKQTLLRKIGVSREKYLSPKCKTLYRMARRYTKSLQYLQKRGKTLKRQLNLTKEEMLDRIILDLNPTVAKFVKSQVRLANKEPKARRYTLDDKILGLVLNKQSAKSYKVFSKIFAVPSKKTMNLLLSKVPINTGINPNIFLNIKQTIQTLDAKDQLSILIFDEMAIEPHIDVNKSYSDFDGFEDDGKSKTNIIADHVLVFMLRGLTKMWKQAIAFSFCRSSTKTIDLVRNIKEIIRECQNISLKVIATVSDQGSTNQAAVNYLQRENR